jgi:hypothetical protein
MKEGNPMIIRSRTLTPLFLATLAIGLNVTPALAGFDWVCCGYHKPEPTGPSNNCYGYYPTVWRAWPPECQPCATSFPVTAPANGTPVTPESKPAATEKATKTPVHTSVISASTNQPAPPKPIIGLPKAADSGWTPIPASSNMPK